MWTTFSAIVLLLQQASAHLLPPTTVNPRTFGAWHARMQEEDSRGTQFVERYPKLEREFHALKARHAALAERYPESGKGNGPMDASTARSLIAELYVDNGHLALNDTAHDYIINILVRRNAHAGPEGLTAEARTVLAEGVMQYLRKGGAQNSPAMRSWVAETLDLLAPDNPGAQAMVEELLADALLWAEEIDSDVMLKSVYRRCARRWGDDFWLSAYDAQAPALPQPHPKAYTDAVQLLEELLAFRNAREADERFRHLLHDAASKATRRFEQDAFENDLITRLLLAYRILLDRDGPPIPDDAVKYIDRSLLELGRERDRLRSERHWRLWGRAVGEVKEKRISGPLLEFVRSLLRKNEELPEPQQAALPIIERYNPAVWKP